MNNFKKWGQLSVLTLTMLLGVQMTNNHADAYVFDTAKFQKGQVPDTRQAPFSSIVFIVDGETGDSASGVLIAPDTVLTAAHVVLRERDGAAANPSDWPRQLINPSSLSIRPAYGGDSGATAERYPFGWYYHGQTVSIPAEYFEAALRPGGDAGDNDIALIHLNQPVQGAPTLSLAEFRPQDVNREIVSVIGFPATLGPGNNAEPENLENRMYADYGTVATITGRQLLTTNVNWSNGNSGGPMLNAFNQVVGIVSASNSYGNFATRIDSGLNCWIQERMHEHEQALAPENSSGRWRQLGNQRVYFDQNGEATAIVSQENEDNLGVLDLSLPGRSNHSDL
ncbi:heat-shock protein htrA serine protease [Fructobacillus pseudoficulneus]|uniref:Serine protease n=1 Tax=Fructobacillus pseudoficulneus TaxID=220714 RepID=A0A3F3GR96_9LACO|nr:S1 family peptidase [Fructobacillus pseudoficulneus]GAP02235.1 heat-shock protein htrA serine protease [Fructobacillus pseudoficulneus]SEH36156.1 V8-like Glu-specific endopeptidase [Fructobacillus pseudoficulneus]